MENVISANFIFDIGADKKMFTLWRQVGPKAVFIKNLGIDYQESLEKANQLAQNAGCELIIATSQENAEEIVRGEDVLRSGKHKDKRISELPDGYLLWLAGGAQIKHNDRVEIFFNTSLVELAKIEAQKRGHYVEHNGKLIPKSLYAYIQKQEAMQHGHFYSGSERVTLNLEVVKEGGYETAYGYTSIITMLDEQNRVFTYKGSKFLCIETKYFINNHEGVESRPIKKGDKITVTGTIKHDSYNGQNETYLQRIVVKPIEVRE